MAQYSTINDTFEDDETRRLCRVCGFGCLGFLVLTSFIALCTSFVVVAPAHACTYKTLGKVADTVLSPGVHIVTPFSSLDCFSLRKQLLETNNSVPTQEGLTVYLDVAILFALDRSKVKTIYVTVGPDYVHNIIEPELASAIRSLTAEQDAKALYTSGRQHIQDELMTTLTVKFDPYGIRLEDVLLKSIKLPDLLVDAIEAKARAEQEADQMQFVLQKEQSEAERKKIEAQGIAAFQQIVSEGISPQLLQWKGIEATEKFATSANTKIVIVGNSGDSLPVLLSSDTPSQGAQPGSTPPVGM